MLAKQARKASKKGTTSGPVSASTEANFGDAIPTGYEKAGFGRGRGKKVPNFGAAGARSAGVPASMVPQPPVYGQYANAVPMQAPYPVQPPHMQMPMQGYPPMQQANAVPMHQAPMQQPMHGHMYGQPYQQQYPSYSNTVQPPPPPPAPVPYMGSYSSTGLQYGMPQVAAPYPPAGKIVFTTAYNNTFLRNNTCVMRLNMCGASIMRWTLAHVLNGIGCCCFYRVCAIAVRSGSSYARLHSCSCNQCAGTTSAPVPVHAYSVRCRGSRSATCWSVQCRTSAAQVEANDSNTK